jgi:uncharacterized protein YcnI
MRTRTLAGRGITAVALVVGLVTMLASAASAHATITPSEVPAGGFAVVTISATHGCEGSPTTVVRIQMPESIPQVTPEFKVNWAIEKVTETLDEPIDTGEGDPITERVTEVIYTATTPLPADQRDSFDLGIRVPDTPDETIYFPTIQECETGELAWIQIPSDGDASDDLESPAPAVMVTASEGDGHGNGGDAEATEADHEASSDDDDAADEATETAADESEDGDGGSDTLAIVAIVLGVVALVVGGLALARSGRS